MEDQNKHTGVIAPGDANSQATSSVVLAQPQAEQFDPQALSDAPAIAQPVTTSVYPGAAGGPAKPWFKWGMLGIASLILVGGVAFAMLSASNRGAGNTGGNVSKLFETTSVPLDDIHVEPIVNLSNTKTVVINGNLTVRDGLVVAPTVQPANAQAGQIYYDINSNTLAYFNGTSFVSVGGDVVTEINELTGNIPLGAGLADVGGQLVNTGVLSVQGQTGNVTFTGGNGISISGTTITNAGVISVSSSSPTLLVSNDGNGNVNLTLNGGGTGTVTSSGGTADRIAKFTTGQNIEDSLLGESGATVTVNGNLAVTGGVTLSSPLSVSSGGTGAATLGANGVLVGNGAAAITSVVSGAAGLCLVSTAGAPTWATCSPPSSTVNSLNGLTGTLTVANATGLVDTITIDDASTANKGIVQFNGTNFSVVSGVANTIQNINTGASPTFSSLTLAGDAAVNGGDITSTGLLNITPAGTLTAGSATQAFTVQGNASSVFTATNGANTTTVSFQVPTASVNYRFATAAVGNYDICTTANNCVGGGGVTGSGTAGTIPVFTGASAIGDSLVSQLGGTVTVNGNLSLTAGNQFQINGTQISSANLSNDSNLAKLNASQTFTGNNVAFQNGSNSATAFAVQNAAGNRLATVDTTGGELELGQGSTIGGRLVFNNATNNNTLTLVSAVSTINRTITFPDDSGTVCLDTGNCAGAGATLQTSYNNSTNPEIVLDSTRGALTLRDNAVALGANLFEVQNNAGGVTYFAVSSSGVTVTGTATATGNINSSGGALQTGGTTRVDNSGNLTNIGNLGLTGAISGGTSVTGSGNFNTTGGSLQTNSTTRVDNSGNLVNIGNITASGNATLQGGSITLGTTSQAGSIVIHDGSSNIGTLQVASLGQDTVYTLPDPVSGTATICLTTGNCAGTGTGVTSVVGGTANRLAKFTAAQNIEDSTITDNGTTVTTTVDLVVQGGDATIGVASTQTGTINLAHSGSVNLGSIVQGALTGNRTYTLPDSTGTICLSSGNCLGGGGGGANTALSNLTGVAINTTLLPGTAGTVHLGSAALPFGDAFLAGTSAIPGTNNFRITGASTSGTRVITLPDATGTVCLQSSAACGFAPSSGSVNYIQNQIASPQTSANFSIDGEGRAATFNATTGINTGAGGGTQRIDASGNLGNIGTLTLSGAISGGTSFTGSGNVNSTGGAIQTNSVNRIDNSGNLVNIGTITASGSATLQGGTATLGTTTQAGSLVLHDGSGDIGTLQVAALGQDTVYTLPDPGAGSANICLSTGNCLGPGGSGANTALSNLASVAINTTLLPGAAGSVHLGSGTLPFGDLFLAGSSGTPGTNNFQITGTSTSGTRVITLPDATGTVCLQSSASCGFAPASGSTNYIQNQIASPQTSANFNIDGQGRAATFNATTGINTGAGAGTQRIDSSGNLVNIGNLTAAAGITIASTGAGNDVTVDGADQFIIQDVAVFNALGTFNSDVDFVLSDTENVSLANTVTGTNAVNLLQSVLTNNTGSGTQNVALLQNAAGNGVTEALLALDNADTDTAVTSGLIVTTAAGGVTNALDVSDPEIVTALLFGANDITGTNFTVAGGSGNVTGGTYNGQTVSATANFTGTLTVANNLTLTAGDIAVDGGDITSTGALNITPGGTLTAGATTQTLTLQGNGSTTLTSTVGANTTTIGFTSPTANTTLNFPALSAGTYSICTSSGNCLGAGVTLQSAYNNSTTPEIVLDATRAALTIRDNATPVVGNLFEVQNNGASTTYFAVTNAGVETTGTMTSSGNINTTGGALQTNSTSRIDNTGNLVNIGNLTASGAITIASTNATNDIILNSADTIELQSATNVTGTLSTTSTVTLGALGTTDTSAYLCRNSSNQLAACNTTGSGAAFVQGGNSFGAPAVLGTNENFGLDIRTNSATRMSIGAGGGVLIQGNATADELEVGDDIFNLNDANARINLGSSANDSYIRMGESSLVFGFVGWQNSSNAMRLSTFGANDVRIETNSTARLTVSGAGVTSIAGTGSSGVAGFSVSTTQNSTTGLQPANSLSATLDPGGAASASYFGTQMTVNFGTTGTTFTGDIVANLGQVNWSGASNTSNTGKVVGVLGKVVTNAGAGSVQNAIGVMGELQHDASTTVTNSYNIYSGNLKSGSTTNFYGLYSENLTGGTNNYPLYLASSTANQPLLSVTNTGATTLRNSTNNSSAFLLQNATGVTGLNIDTTTPNLITNHSFETDTSGWTASGAATLSRVTSQYRDNNASLQIAATAAANDGARYAYALQSSTQYSLSIFVKGSVDGFNALEIGRSEDGSTDTSCATNSFNTNYFARYTCTFTTGTVSGSPYIYVKQTDATARNMWVDAVQLETAASPTLYANSKVALSGTLSVNYGSTTASTSNSALSVKAVGGGDGLHVQGNGEFNIFQNIFVVSNGFGTPLVTVSEASSGTTIQGGSSFFNSAALTAVSTNSGAAAIEIQGASGQTADILKLQDSSDVNMLTVGATGAVLSKNTTNSTAAFQVQNAAGTTQLTVDTTNSRVSVGASDTTGALLVLDTKTDINDPTGVNGAMYYNSAYGRFRCFQNSVWVDCIGSSAREYIRLEAQAEQTDLANEADDNDHIKFDTVANTSGSGMTLDTTSTYVETGGASRGRITLAAGKTYRLHGTVPYVEFNVAAGYMEYAWYDVTSGTELGTRGGNISAAWGGNITRDPYAEAIFTPSTTTLVELRLVATGDTVDQIGFTASRLYPSAYIEVLSDGGAGGSSAAEYLRAEMAADQSTNVSANDHIKFNSVQASSGSSITLDTATAYTSGAGASVGRYTLTAGKTYMLRATIPRVVFGSADSSMQYRWYDVTAGAVLGTTGGSLSTAWSLSNIANDPYAETIISPSVTTLIELRIVGVSGTVSTIGDGGSGRMPSAFIEVLSDGTKIAQFQGATSLANGQAGYVPMPTAGQQGSLLLGDGTWSTGVTVIGSSLGLGISPTSKLHVYEGTTGGLSLAMFRDNPNGSAIEIISIGTNTSLLRAGADDSLNFAGGNSSTPQLTLSSTGAATFQNGTDSTAAFSVKNSQGNSVISIDTTGYNQNNLITNSSFETNTTGWTAKGTPTTFARDTTQYYNGSASVKFTTQAVANQGIKYDVTLADSTTYNVLFYARLDTATDDSFGDSLSAGYSSDGTTDTNATCSTKPNSVLKSTSWQNVRCTFTTPSSHSGTPFFYIKSGSAAVETYFVDAVLLQTDANSDSNYRDGKISLQGTIVSPVTIQDTNGNGTFFSVQNSQGSEVFSVTNGTYNGYSGNLITNSDFETNVVGWTPVGAGATIQRRPGQHYTGYSSMQITTGAVADSGAKFVTGNDGPTALEASWNYQISFYAKASTGSLTDITMAYSYDGNAASEAGDTCTTFTIDSTGWARIECVIVTNAGAPTASAYIIIKQETSTSSRTFYVDGVLVTEQFDNVPTGYGTAAISLNGTIVSPVTFRALQDSPDAFAIQNPFGVSMFQVDTDMKLVYIGDQYETTSFPTVLVLDSSTSSTDRTGVPDGAMYYNSTMNRMRCYEQSRWTNCTSSVNEYDISDRVNDFVGGDETDSTGGIGEGGWSAYSNATGLIAAIAGEQNHPGIWRFGTAASSNAIMGSCMVEGSGDASTTVGTSNYYAAIVRPASGTTSMGVRFGFMNSVLASGESTQGVYFSFNSATSANWRTVTRGAGGITSNTSSVAYSASTWYRLEIKKNNSNNWEFYINGTLVATHSANIPSATTTASPCFHIETSNTTQKTIDVDWLRYRSDVLSR